MKTKKVNIEKMDHNGRGIGYIDGKIVFVPYALPEEEVTIEVTKEKKKYCEGRLIKINAKSSKRIKPVCPYFFECGGCDLMHMNYEEQLLWKEKKVKEILEKFAHISSSCVKNIVPSREIHYYRNKITLQVKETVGFYGKKSNQIVPIETCMISDKKINHLISLIRKFISFSNIRQIVIRTSRNKEDCMLIFDVEAPLSWEEIIPIFKDEVTSIQMKQGSVYQTIYGKDTISESLNNTTFEIRPEAFFQVNTKETEVLYQTAISLCQLKKDETVLDLYCGTGTIGLSIAPFTKEVIGVEVNAQAIESAKKNQKINHTNNVTWYLGRVEEVVPQLNVQPDIVIVDPPRSGLDRKTVQKLNEWKLKQIIYISCDPVTLARDIEVLQQEYTIETVIPVDMFPQTKHVECVALLARKKNEKTQ